MTVQASSSNGASDRPTRWDPGFLASLMRSDRLTLVFSPAGADRDAMVQRTLMPMLGRRAIDRSMADAAAPTAQRPAAERRRRRHDSQRGAEVVIRFDGWGAQPLSALRAQIAAVLPPPPGEQSPPSLAAMLNAAARAHDTRLLLVFDGFERHLAASPDEFAEVLRFDRELIDWLRQPLSPARVLFLVDDASQERLLRRYGESMQQFGRGWLRIRPQAQTMSGSATTALKAVPKPATSPAPEPVQAPVQRAAADPPTAESDEEADEISRFVRDLDLGTPDDEPGLSVESAEAIVAERADDVPWAEPPARRGLSTWAGVALGVMLGLAISAAGWLLWRQGGDAPVAAAPTPATPTPAAAMPRPAAGDSLPGAVARPVAPAPQIATAPRPLAPTPAAGVLEIAALPESGQANTLLDELSREVAPAGLSLRLAPPVGPATVALLRSDALPAAREASVPAGPRLLLPLFREQVQVLARTDGRWRFLHQLKGAHLNVGEAGGARARTANAVYRRLFGGNLPSWDIDRRDEASALRELLREGSALDAVFIVSDRPALELVPAAMRGQLRVLGVDPQHPSTAELMRGFAVPAEAYGRAPLPQVTSYLVGDAAGPAPALQALGCALVRAQPALQQRGSTLMRGIDSRTSVPAGWVSALAPGGASCLPR